MKKLLLFLLIALAVFAVYWFKFRGNDTPEGPKQQPLVAGKHSAAFNAGVDSLMHFYFDIKDGFVAGDSLKAKQSVIKMAGFISAFRLDELKKDTSGIYESAQALLNDIKTNAEAMGQSQTIIDMRQDFKNMSENLYPFLKTIHYEGPKLYWQNCADAFGEGQGADWLSSTEAIANPYQGKSKVDCGEIKDTIKAQ